MKLWHWLMYGEYDGRPTWAAVILLFVLGVLLGAVGYNWWITR